MEGANTSIRILDRLLQEIEVSKSEMGSIPTEAILKVFDKQIINETLYAWRLGCATGQMEMSPEELVALLDHYRLQVPDLGLDATTYEIVMEGSAIVGHENEPPVFAESLLDRMIKESDEQPNLRPSLSTFHLVMDLWARDRSPRAPDIVEGLFQRVCTLYEANWHHLAPVTHTYLLLMKSLSSSPERAEEILRAMQNSTYPGVCCTSDAYAAVIDIWSKSKGKYAIVHAQNLLMEVHELHESGTGDIRPTASSYCSVISCCLRCDDLATALELFGQMQTQYADGNLDLRPTNDVYHALIKYLCTGGCYTLPRKEKRNRSEKAQIIFDSMVDQYAAGDSSVQPTTDIYNCLIEGWAACGDGESAESVLHRIFCDFTEGNLKAPPDSITLNSALTAWAWSKLPNASSRAESMLHLFLELNQSGHLDVKPDNNCFRSVLNCVTKSGSHDAAQRADKLLRKMKDASMQPTSDHYNIVMAAWSRSQNKFAAERVGQLFQELEQKHETTGKSLLKPTVYSYTTMISALGKTRHHKSGRKAQSIFDDLMAKYAAGDSSLRPNFVTYMALLSVWAKAGNGERAEKTLNAMLDDFRGGNKSAKPQSRAFGTVLVAWSWSKDREAPHRAEALFQQMVELSQGKDTKVAPTTLDARTVLNSWVNSDEYKASERAEHFLRHMWDLYDGGFKNLKPDIACYNFVLKALSRSNSNDAAARVQALVEDMSMRFEAGETGLKPGSLARSYQMMTLSRCPRPGSVQEAQDIFDLMVEEFEAGRSEMRPSGWQYNLLIDVYSRSGDGNRAEVVLRAMFDEYSTGFEEAKPGICSFNTVLRAWSRAKDPDALKRAQGVLDVMKNSLEMEALNIKPDVITYNAILSACASSQDAGASDSAETYLKEIKDRYTAGDLSCKPNRRTYHEIIRVWTARGDAEGALRAEELLKELLELSKEGGLLPTYTTLSMVVSNMCKSEVADRAERAQRILETMHALGMKPQPSLLKKVKSCFLNLQSSDNIGSVLDPAAAAGGEANR
jgi:pentatricopeptide repeat protein